jgi:hypothetical protein
MLKSTLRGAALLVLSAAPLVAQSAFGDAEDFVASSVVASGRPVDVATAMRRCVDLDSPAWLASRAPASACRVKEWGPLKAVDGTRFFYARYEYPRSGPAASHGGTQGLARTVVFARMPDGRVRPEWYAVFEREFYLSVTPRVEPAPGGGALVSVESCVNGTGGCSQDFLLRRGGRWSTVRQRWVGQLPAAMKGRFWKGTYVDPATLRGRFGLYGDRDPNCCPSRSLAVRVALVGTSLVLRGYRVGPPEGSPETP